MGSCRQGRSISNGGGFFLSLAAAEQSADGDHAVEAMERNCRIQKPWFCLKTIGENRSANGLDLSFPCLAFWAICFQSLREEGKC